MAGKKENIVKLNKQTKIFNMKKLNVIILFLMASIAISAQTKDVVIENIIKEANENSHLEKLGHELMDVIGPRLVGTPQMKQANDWAVAKYKSWGIAAKNEKWGEWRGWERGITHIDMLSPRVQSLKGTQLAWNPSTSDKGVTGEVVIIPKVANKAEFEKWAKSSKGRLISNVLISYLSFFISNYCQRLV